jgi:hypothetical protein
MQPSSDVLYCCPQVYLAINCLFSNTQQDAVRAVLDGLKIWHDLTIPVTKDRKGRGDVKEKSPGNRHQQRHQNDFLQRFSASLPSSQSRSANMFPTQVQDHYKGQYLCTVLSTVRTDSTFEHSAVFIMYLRMGSQFSAGLHTCTHHIITGKASTEVFIACISRGGGNNSKQGIEAGY